MAKTQEQILANQLAKLGAIGGGASSLSQGVIGGIGGVAGGYLGAKLAARFLPTETYTISKELGAPASDVLKTVYGILKAIGRIRDDVSDDSPVPKLYAAVGSGAMNLNPTLIAIAVIPLSETSATVAITGAAKEGLIKQHSAQKAVARVVEYLSKAYPSQA